MEMSDDYQDIGTPGGGATMANLPLPHHGHTPDSPLSHQEEDSDPDLQDEESGEELLAQPRETNTHTSTDKALTPTGTPAPMYDRMNFLSQTNDMDVLNNKSGLEALQAAMGSGFTLPFPFPPPAAFLPPQHRTNNNNTQTSSTAGTTKTTSYSTFTSGNNNIVPSSASSHSSESSQGSGKISEARDNSGQQNNNNAHQSSWSFEEQFKQVRQLYEINDDPKRKEFLDDLFSYMQKRGTPINRLPIMAKSVLDLYELYNLVIARGGLVDVINKKLWQEIIKGLHLPSSITSAAFTLRTQYMKYLYPYECEKRRLSTPAELQAAIDGNRREGRRSSYGAYGGGGGDSMIQRSPHTPNPLSLHAQMSPLSLVTGVGGQHQALANGSAAHTPLPHHPHHPQHPQGQPSTGLIPGLAPAEFEARMVEYVKLLNKELRNAGAGTPPPMIHRQGSVTSPSETPPRDSALNALEMSRLTLWNMYNNNTLYPGVGQQPPLSPQAHSPHPQTSSPEPQSEALDLGRRSSSVSSSPVRHSPPSSSGSIQVKRDHDLTGTPGLQNFKRSFSDDEGLLEKNNMPTVSGGTHIKISNRGDGRNGDNSLVVSMEINGIMYEGVLFAQSEGRTANPTNNNNNTKTQRSLVSQ